MNTVTLPDGPALPRFVQGGIVIVAPLWMMRRLRERYGSAFKINVPIFGDAVVISDPAEVKQLFMTSPDIADILDINLGLVLGPNSFFAISDDAHRKQRKLLSPPFHGRRLRAYEAIIEQEAVREMAAWPEGTEFATLDSMMRITLNAILRAVFGAEGARLQSLETLIPRWTALGRTLSLAPEIRRNFGPWSPWPRFTKLRERIDAVLDELIAAAKSDDALPERADVLALMVQATHEDGTPMTNAEIRDELVTMLVAGHETTANTLAWAVERLRRHPDVVARLVEEVEQGGKALREATIREVQRTRPVIGFAGRIVRRPFELGGFRLPVESRILLAACLTHYDPGLFPEPDRFNPDRFLDMVPDTYSWIPFGGGRRRCIGATFAHMEMDVVLRELLSRVELVASDEEDEPWSFGGVVWYPRYGGRAVIRQRSRQPVSPQLAAA